MRKKASSSGAAGQPYKKEAQSQRRQPEDPYGAFGHLRDEDHCPSHGVGSQSPDQAFQKDGQTQCRKKWFPVKSHVFHMAETGIFVKDKTMVDFAALQNREQTLAVVGLGYVGLPLAVAFSRHMNVLGFDINAGRIEELRKGHDRTNEVTDEALAAATIEYTCDPADLARAAVIIVAVPTPIDEHRSPDLTPVVGASHTVGRHMPKGCVVVYESTVYPGLTEEICVPILEQESGLTYGTDFTVGYSPERINPGDKVHTLETIKKIVSGSDQATADLLAQVYGSVVKAGIHRASSIKVAEAAKVIENTQRDLNIALMNELAIIFERLGIDTLEVLEAAGTKWNFLPFRPGLVGGHCIGVDPYYLTSAAEMLGYHSQIILNGRKVNDSMGAYVADAAIKQMIEAGLAPKKANVVILGITFKENCPDTRNSKVVDIIKRLREYEIEPVVTDSWADAEVAKREYHVELTPYDQLPKADCLIVAVGHNEFRSMSTMQLKKLFRDVPDEEKVLIDVKSLYRLDELKASGMRFWRL